MAVSEEVKKQFVDYIMLQVFDDQYLDRTEEKKILEEGVRKGISVDEGLAIIRQVADDKGLALERNAEDRAKEMLEAFAENDGKVDKKEFEDALGLLKKHSKGKIPEAEMKRRLKKMMEDNGWNAKEGGLFGSKWYSAIE
jgi:Ca2+-binding EF-hand superfamily protein